MIHVIMTSSLEFFDLSQKSNSGNDIEGAIRKMKEICSIDCNQLYIDYIRPDVREEGPGHKIVTLCFGLQIPFPRLSMRKWFLGMKKRKQMYQKK